MHNRIPRCVFVTGGADYIGSHICKALVKTSYAPVSYDNHNLWARMGSQMELPRNR